MKKAQVGAAAAALLLASAMTGAVNIDAPYWQSPDGREREPYVPEPMPAGVQVIPTELEGPVFADAHGKTLYTWPLTELRNGGTGDRRGSPSVCGDQVIRETSGLMSPYPAGLQMPELDTRPSCSQVWPPFLATEDTKPIGKWTIVPRQNGTKQWAYDGFPLYTFSLDQKAGDVLGGTKLERAADAPVARDPVGPHPNNPPEFLVVPTATGRLLVNDKGSSVYARDMDAPGKSGCHAECLQEWTPVLAPDTAVAQGQWTLVVRSPGVKQWAFRTKPLYTYNKDVRTHSLEGADIPGWHNVYTQRVLPPPKGFTVQDSRIGQVLANARGMTIYFYNCADDALDQLPCDHPDTTQAFRLAICGNGDPKLCQETFPYVTASPDAKSDSALWSVMSINPQSGHRATAGDPGAIRVWAYRDRPVYTYAQDRQPGDADGDAWGEFYAARNGFKAFWLRDDFLDNTTKR